MFGFLYSLIMLGLAIAAVVLLMAIVVNTSASTAIAADQAAKSSGVQGGSAASEAPVVKSHELIVPYLGYRIKMTNQ